MTDYPGRKVPICDGR